MGCLHLIWELHGPRRIYQARNVILIKDVNKKKLLTFAIESIRFKIKIN